MPFIYVQDVHERFRTESHLEAAGRFNERFLLSLASCKACVVMDDELNILPISSHIKSIVAAPVKEDFEGLSEAERDLKNLKEQLHDDFPVGPLIKKCCTLDQGKAVITFLDAILDKTLRSTIALLAARGRGKSAALGLAVAGAIAAGYSNVFVTAPSPENLKTLFEFICRGFDALEYKVLSDLENIRTTLEEGNGRAVSVSCWAEAAGLDVKVLQQQLRYGWYCRDELVRSTRSLVIFLARNYRGMGIALEDLIQVVETAFSLEEAGCFSIVLVCVHAPVAAAAATFAIRIPTIGIGAGPFCSGQDMRDLRIMLTGVVKQLNKRQGGEKETDSRDSRVSEPAVTHLQSGRTQGQNNLQGTPQTQQHQQ